MNREPEREVRHETNLAAAASLLLNSDRIANTAAADPLKELIRDIEREATLDEDVANSYCGLQLPSGPLADLRGVERRTLGRALRAAFLPTIERDNQGDNR